MGGWSYGFKGICLEEMSHDLLLFYLPTVNKFQITLRMSVVLSVRSVQAIKLKKLTVTSSVFVFLTLSLDFWVEVWVKGRIHRLLKSA